VPVPAVLLVPAVVVPVPAVVAAVPAVVLGVPRVVAVVPPFGTTLVPPVPLPADELSSSSSPPEEQAAEASENIAATHPKVNQVELMRFIFSPMSWSKALEAAAQANAWRKAARH